MSATHHVLSVVGISLVLIAACNTAVAPPPDAEVKAVATTGVASPAPAVSINEVMVSWIDHSGHELWDVEQQGRAPKNDAEWREVERHATQLAASGTLIAVGGTGPADPGWASLPDWKRYSQQLSSAGVAARDAARGHDFDALVKANGALVESCEGCHKQFKPALPTEGLSHQPH